MKNLAILDEMELKLAKERKLVLFDEFTRESVFVLQYQLNKIVETDRALKIKKPEPVDIIISSYGGNVLDCLPLLGQIEKMKEQGYIINTITNGYSISCGFMLAIIGSKGHRKINRYGKMLCHQMSTGSMGTLQSMEENMEFDKRLWEQMKQIIMQNTKMSSKFLDIIKKQKLDYWMFPEEAQALGCVDEII